MMFDRPAYSISRVRTIALGFLIIICAGTLLLMTPIASSSGEWTGFLTAFFTATSATCVTGLTVVNTYTAWSTFGQVVILILIQIGGLGFITIGVGFSLFLRRRITLMDRGLLKESVNVVDIGGIVEFARMILAGALGAEVIGAVILTICFLPDMGFGQALYYGIFHSVSAFCNAGFDLMGQFGYSSFMGYNDNPVVCITIILLILFGGIGFFVWADVRECKLNFRKYALHTKIVLSMTFILVFGGAVLFFVLERDNAFADMGTGQAILNAIFCAVTPRTAGFNTVDSASLTNAGKLLTIIFMFIGGCPGSTAGGIKVTTIAVLILYLRSSVMRTDGVNVFNRRLEDDAIAQATKVFTINLFLVTMAIFVLAACSNFDLTDLMFEAVSAIGTVGMSTGITSSLSVLGKLIIIALMYLGRVGSLSFAMSFTEKKKIAHVRQPKEHINIG